jgi:propanol-preferring alcohol dehydrogenase
MVCSLEDSGLKAGEWAVFPGGGGGVGIQGVQLAKAMGFRPVVVDTGDAKRKLSLDMGAEAFVDFKETPDVAEEVKKICDGVGAHGVFCTAPPGYKTAIALVGDRVSARVMCIGLPPKDSEMILGVSPYQYAVKNLRVSG